MIKKISLAIALIITIFSITACGGASVDLANDELYGTWYYYAEENALQVSAKFNEDGSGHFHSVYGGITTADYDFSWENNSGSIKVTWDNEGTETNYTLNAQKDNNGVTELTGSNDLELKKN